jgi:general secretion pathway protein A
VLLALNAMLVERTAAGRTTVLIVDEAHNLDWDVLEEIRLLGNLETRKGKLLQVVVAGQQELDAKLDRPEFRQLKQRISLRCTLRGFDALETAAYIDSRMARAGVRDQKMISWEIIREVHYRSQGIPRLINAICDNLLLTSFALECKIATMEMLDEVTSDMRLDYPEKPLYQKETRVADVGLRQPIVPYQPE